MIKNFFKDKLMWADNLLRHKFGFMSNNIVDSPFEELESEDVEFVLGHPWGNNHPEQPHQWWKRGGNVELPRTVFDREYTTSSREISVLYGTKFYTGERYVEVVCSLPHGNNLWYAPLWGHADPTPPEYDVIELYSDENGVWKAESNFHFGLDYKDNKKNLKARDFYLRDRGFHRFGVLFKEDYLEYYYNGRPFRRIDGSRIDHKHLEPMNVIVQSGIKKEKDMLDKPSFSTVESAKVYYL